MTPGIETQKQIWRWHLPRYSKPSEPEAKKETNTILSFEIDDPKFAATVNDKLSDAQWEHKNFYYRYIETKTKHIVQIHTKDVEEDDLKKILFLVGLKQRGRITKR